MNSSRYRHSRRRFALNVRDHGCLSATFRTFALSRREIISIFSTRVAVAATGFPVRNRRIRETRTSHWRNDEPEKRRHVHYVHTSRSTRFCYLLGFIRPCCIYTYAWSWLNSLLLKTRSPMRSRNESRNTCSAICIRWHLYTLHLGLPHSGAYMPI